MPRFDALPDTTAAILRRIAKAEEARGFILIGGTALALQWGHRVSEDIDLVWPGGGVLPRREIGRLLKAIGDPAAARLVTDEGAILYAENDGIDLGDFQQDWQIGETKLTFFAPYEAAERSIIEGARPQALGTIGLLGADDIFRLKSLLLLKRTASRDLFDLWFFISRRGKSVGDVVAAVAQAAPHYSEDYVLDRLAPPRLPLADPGFQPIEAAAPEGETELLAEMNRLVAAYRVGIARYIALDEGRI
jgi:hypothetical protein